MKNLFKKFTSAGILLVSSLSMIQMGNAFQHMDVCNYTFGDYSGDYYDRLCTEDGQPSEYVNFYSSNIDTDTEEGDNTTSSKEYKNHDLEYVQHKTGASFPLIDLDYSSDRDEEIEELKSQLLKSNQLLEEYKNKTDDLVENQERLLHQTISEENNVDETVSVEEDIQETNTPVKKTIKYTNTPMEDIVVDQSVIDFIRARIERNNLRNAMEQKN